MKFCNLFAVFFILLSLTINCSAQRVSVDYASSDIGTLTTGTASPSDDTGTWSQFRGDNRSGIVPDALAINIAKSWPDGGPKVLWQTDLLGEGYSGPSIHTGRIFINDYDPKRGLWMVRCLSLADGGEIWRWSYKRRIRKNHGMTRTVAATNGELVFSLDPKSVLHCLDAKTGQRKWAINLVSEFSARIPPWYNGQCPLLDDGKLILGIGGKDALMIAINPADGNIIWTAPNSDKHMMSHSSVMPAEISGVKQYIWCTLKGLVSVDAATGQLLWSFDGWKPNVACAPSALHTGGGKILMSAGYKAGAVIIEVAKSADQWAVTEKFTATEEQFNCDTQTGIMLDENTVIAVNHYDKAGRLSAIDTSGKILWQREDVSFGLGNFIRFGNFVIIADGDSGALALIEVSATGYKEISTCDIAAGHEVWAPFAYADGKLLVRNHSKLFCLNVASK